VKRHSLTPSLRQSGVGFAQTSAIQFALAKWCLSAIADIGLAGFYVGNMANC
jgi:hypothetical protein